MGVDSLEERGEEGGGIVVSNEETLKGEGGLGVLSEGIKEEDM